MRQPSPSPLPLPNEVCIDRPPVIYLLEPVMLSHAASGAAVRGAAVRRISATQALPLIFDHTLAPLGVDPSDPPRSAWSAMSILSRALLLALVVLAAACGPGAAPPASIVPDAHGTDVEEVDTEPSRDVPTPPDASDDASDVIPPDPVEIAVGVGVNAVLADGREVTGELVALYDHRDFWFEPEDRETWALFEPARLEEAWDRDRSFVFVDVREVVSAWAWELPLGRVSYRQALRDRGIVLERSPLEQVGHVLMAGDAWHLEEDGYGHFAIDLVLTDDAGRTFVRSGVANEDYLVWDAPLALPVGGTVVEVVRDAPDGDPVFDHVPLEAVNNMIGVHLWGSFYVYLLHQRQGTIPADIMPGDWLAPGAYVGRVGNSGVTQVPHLHLVLLWYDVVAERSWSVPLEFAGLWLAPDPAGASWVAPADPWTGDWIADTPF